MCPVGIGQGWSIDVVTTAEAGNGLGRSAGAAPGVGRRLPEHAAGAGLYKWQPGDLYLN